MSLKVLVPFLYSICAGLHDRLVFMHASPLVQEGSDGTLFPVVKHHAFAEWRAVRDAAFDGSIRVKIQRVAARYVGIADLQSGTALKCMCTDLIDSLGDVCVCMCVHRTF